MMRPIASVLVDFGRPSKSPAMPAFTFHASPELAAEVDVEELVRDAEERGYQRGRSEALAEQEAQAAEAQDVFGSLIEQKLAEARQQWVDEEGERIVARMEKAVGALRDTIAARTAEILQTLVEPSLRERMVSELVATLDHLTRQDATMLLRVEGPADLLEAVRKALVGHVRSLDLVESKGVDVRVVAQDSVIETRLGAWISSQQDGGEA